MFALENGFPFPCVVTSPRIVIMVTTSDQGLKMHPIHRFRNENLMLPNNIAERTLPPLPPIESEVHSKEQ